MNEFKIEKGIPLPTAKSNSNGAALRMEIGDSIAFKSKSGAWRFSKYWNQKMPDRKYEAHAIPGGSRVWRLQ